MHTHACGCVSIYVYVYVYVYRLSSTQCMYRQTYRGPKLRSPLIPTGERVAAASARAAIHNTHTYRHTATHNTLCINIDTHMYILFVLGFVRSFFLWGFCLFRM